MPRNEKEAKLAKNHSFNVVNRLEFENVAEPDDPYRLLAAAVILQAAIDEIKGQKKFYWDYGRKVWVRSGMHDEDYQFYADLAGLNVSYVEFLSLVSKKLEQKMNRCTPDAAGMILATILNKEEKHGKL